MQHKDAATVKRVAIACECATCYKHVDNALYSIFTHIGLTFEIGQHVATTTIFLHIQTIRKSINSI